MINMFKANGPFYFQCTLVQMLLKVLIVCQNIITYLLIKIYFYLSKVIGFKKVSKKNLKTDLTLVLFFYVDFVNDETKL